MKDEIISNIRELCLYFIQNEYWNESRLPEEILDDALSQLSIKLDNYKE